MPELPAHEQRRLAVLRDYGILDANPEAELDDIVTLAGEICDAPMALITLIDESRQWLKARTGFTVAETAREHAFCQHALHGPDFLMVPDATQDARFADNPYVRGEPGIRFYAGAALITPEGERLGTLCVLDRRQRSLTPAQQHALKVLSRHVMAHLELGRRLRSLQRGEQRERELAVKLERERLRLVEVQAVAKIGSWETDLASLEVTWSEETHRIFHTDPAAFRPTHTGFLEFVHPEDRAAVQAAFLASASSRDPQVIEHRLLLSDGTLKTVEERWQVIFNNSGQPLRAIGTCQDVSARRQHERERLRLIHNLGERVKELRALHQAADLLRQHDRPLSDILAGLVGLLPPAMQYPEISAACIRFGPVTHATPLWRESPWELNTRFTSLHGTEGIIRVIYLEDRPAEAEGPFMAEERKLIESVAEMLCGTIDRRDAESVVREAQIRQSLILDSVTEGIHGLDRQGCVIFENAAGAALLGWQPEELIGRHSHAVIHHHHADGSPYPVEDCPIYRTLRDGVVRRVADEVFFRKDGSHFPVEYTCSPVRDASGAITGAVVSFHDITLRRQSEGHLERLRNLARMTSRLARIGAWEVDLPTGTIFWSDEVRAMHEAEESFEPDVEGGLAFYTPETRPMVREAFLRCAQEGTPFDLEAEIVSRRGRRFWVRAIGEAVRDSTGAIVRVQGAFQDIEESKRAAQELLEARSLHTGLVNTIDGIVWEAKAADLHFTFVSDQAERILGYPVRAWLEQPDFWTQHIHPEEREATVAHCLAAARRKENHTFEYRMLAANGRVIWMRDIVTYVALPDRAPVLRGIMLDITALKQAEAQSRQSERRLVTTLENITDAFFTLDGDWRFTFLNREAERLLRRPREELLGRVLWDEFPEARGSLFEEQYRRSAQTRQSVSFEAHYPPLGTWFEVRAHPSEFGLAVHFRDINERRAAAEALRLNEERFRLLAKATYDAVWDWNLVSDTVWWSEGYEQLFGRRRDDIEPSSKSWTDYIHPDDLDRVTTSIHGVIDGEATEWSSEYRFRRADGTYLPVADRGEVLRDATGKAVRMIGGMTDLTERKQTEAKLREQAALLDQAKDAIIVRDLDHRILYWNRSAERFYGWSASEVSGRSIKELLYTDPSSFTAATAHVLDHGEWTGEIEQLRRDGSALTVEGRWTLLRDESGQPKSILAINTDITERKKLEQQFLRAQRMESIGTLAGGIAHDLNNLLAPISMGVEVIRRYTADAKPKPIIDNIERAARRGADLVKQVLSFARGVEGSRVAIQVRHVVREIESIIENTFPKTILVETYLPDSLWLVIGDPTQINQILLNLSVNARDAMPSGGTLTLAAENIEIDEQYAVMNRGVSPGRYVVLSVTDTGIGMTKEILDRIFDPFFTTKEIGKGTGLGLSTALGIVRSHGGFMNVYSEPGKGSTFKVYLPAQDGTAAEPAAPEIERFPRGNGELILVVDDEASILDITKQTLEAFGYRVITAEDGAQAIGQFALARDQVSAVLTDMMMPVMDGSALIVALRRISPQVRIIAASGLNANGHVAKAANLGIRHFLAKPYSADTLLGTLRQVLTDRGSRPPL